MLFLYVFGAMTEERMGRLQFAALLPRHAATWPCCGYAAANAGSAQTLVGASGAISAVLGAFLCLFPRARVTSLFPFLLLPAAALPGLDRAALLVRPAVAGRAGRSRPGPGVAYLAHLVGFSPRVPLRVGRGSAAD